MNNITTEIAEHINEIFLRHRQQILEMEDCPGECSPQVIASGLKNLECMGYTLDCETIEKLHTSDETAVVEFFDRTQSAVNALVLNDPSKDARLKYEPMYPGFPRQVMEMDSAELYLNALFHYITNGIWVPRYETYSCAANSGDEFVPVNLYVIETGSLEDFKDIFCNLMSANTSISASDVEDLKFFFENFDDAADYILAEPVFKENSIKVAKICLECGLFSLEGFVERFGSIFKNPTDVLRLAAALSGGDASLAEVCRFKSFSRKDRKVLLKLLNDRSSLLENMMPKREMWLRLGERLHPGEYPEFSRVADAFKALRNGVKVRSFASGVNVACECGLFDEAVKLLSQRPGDFARALDRVLRNSPDQKLVLDAFESVAGRVSSRVLLELRTHFQHRSNENFRPMTDVMTPEENQLRKNAARLAGQNEIGNQTEEAGGGSDVASWKSLFDKAKINNGLSEEVLAGDTLAAAINDLIAVLVENSFPEEPGKKKKKIKYPAMDAESIRIFFPKGNLAKSCVIENKLTGIPAESCQRLVCICENALKMQYAEREELGKVWINEVLKDYAVPFSQRSASKALRTIVRGSRLRFSENAKVVRGFVWWKNAVNGTERTDLDLSALLLDKDWKYVEHISWTNLRSPLTNSCHSGDIVDAPDGAAEYIDIDIEAAQKAGVRYVGFSVYGYTMQNFCDLPECSFGWMEREAAEGGMIFDASGVRNKIDLAMPSRCGVPVFFDLQEKCAIWMDMSAQNPLSSSNCIENNAFNILFICRGFVEMRKPNLYDLAVLHAQARGELVEDRDEADVIFDIDEGITPFDTDVWMGEYI